MPLFIVRTHSGDNTDGVVTLAERTVRTALHNDHFSKQLIERVGWGALRAGRRTAVRALALRLVAPEARGGSQPRLSVWAALANALLTLIGIYRY